MVLWGTNLPHCTLLLGWSKAMVSSEAPFQGTPCLAHPMAYTCKSGDSLPTQVPIFWWAPAPAPLSALFPAGSPHIQEAGPEGVYNEITQPVMHSGYLYRAMAPHKLPGVKKSKEGECEELEGAASGTPTPVPLTPQSCRLPAHLVLPGESPAVLRDREMH